MPVSLRIHVLSYDKSVGNLVVVLSEGQADISQHVIVQPVEPAEARFAPRRFQAPDAQKKSAAIAAARRCRSIPVFLPDNQEGRRIDPS
jgi:hypothetical protein